MGNWENTILYKRGRGIKPHGVSIMMSYSGHFFNKHALVIPKTLSEFERLLKECGIKEKSVFKNNGTNTIEPKDEKRIMRYTGCRINEITLYEFLKKSFDDLIEYSNETEKMFGTKKEKTKPINAVDPILKDVFVEEGDFLAIPLNNTGKIKKEAEEKLRKKETKYEIRDSRSEETYLNNAEELSTEPSENIFRILASKKIGALYKSGIMNAVFSAKDGEDIIINTPKTHEGKGLRSSELKGDIKTIVKSISPDMEMPGPVILEKRNIVIPCEVANILREGVENGII